MADPAQIADLHIEVAHTLEPRDAQVGDVYLEVAHTLEPRAAQVSDVFLEVAYVYSDAPATPESEPLSSVESVKLNDQEWKQVSSATVQVLQTLNGFVGVVFADTQPPNSLRAGQMGLLMPRGHRIQNNTGGTSWARSVSGSARLGVTEG